MENAMSFVPIQQRIIEKTNIYSDKYELIDSRTVLCFNSNVPLEIEEVFNSSFKILIRIVSKNDNTGMGLQFNVDKDKNTIEYICSNFDNVLGTGTNEPIEIGTIGGKKFYIHFWIYAMGDEKKITRKVEYSIWKEI